MMFSLAWIFQQGDPTSKFCAIDVSNMSVLQYVTVLNCLFDDFAYIAAISFYY